MAAIYYTAALLIGLVIGVVSAVVLVVQYPGYAVGVGATVSGSNVAHLLPGRRGAA